MTVLSSGFSDLKVALEEEVIAFGKPVVLVHGDSHTFRIDKPAITGNHRRERRAVERGEEER